MIYVFIAAMTVFVGVKFIMFTRNKKNAVSVENIDAMLIKFINGQRN
ncbi:hypothetical protein OXPF_27560 [Oxobacter pfennigii]|uniref:Uncharacterized protein n=1 Tax=Oxobacter pfennigii TaxID=36849 RepID=A0A0P9ADQ9_9CLOT|nr:hypothetical protein [Oxobacter pfennigii]KPU43315.1 hypothetical protein OXPF_27560 [Oxobacter pfennigii]